MKYQSFVTPTVWIALAVVGCSSSTSQSNYDDLRRAAAARQSGYPAPPGAENPHDWASLLSDGGPPINGRGSPSPAAGGSQGAGGATPDAGSGGTGGFGTGASPSDAAVTDTEGSAALNGSTTFSPSASGVVSTSGTDSSASVTALSPSILFYYPNTPTTIGVTYSATNANVDAFSVQFGNATPIRLSDPPASGFQNNSVNLTVTPSSFVCESLNAGCYAATTTVGVLTAPSVFELSGGTRSVPGVLVCGDCSIPSCIALDPKCAVEAPPISCGTVQQVGTSGAYSVNMSSTSGSASLALSLSGTYARFQITDQGSPVYDTGCVTGDQSYPITYSGSSSSLSMTVTTGCNGGGVGTGFYDLSCPAAHTATP